MIASTLLAFVLSGVFVAIAGWYGYRLARPAPGPPPERSDRVSAVAHIAMSLGMVPMLWTWGMGLPVVPQVLLFAVAAAWFLALAVSRAPEHCCSLLGRKRTHLYHLHHFTLMAAMVWMVVAMAVPSLSSHAHAAGAESSMPGMEHSMDHGGHHGMDHSMVQGTAATQATDREGPSAVVTAVTIGLAAYFLILVPWWVYEAVAVRRGRGRRKQRREAALQAGIHALKCGGMAVMLLAMA